MVVAAAVRMTAVRADHALAVLDDAKVLSDGCQYVFPSPRGNHPMRKTALSRAISRNLEALGLEYFQARDLRRTASTRMAEAGIPDFDIRRIQGHALPGMGRVYNVYHYDKEKQRALEKWDRCLREIISGKKRGYNHWNLTARVESAAAELDDGGHRLTVTILEDSEPVSKAFG